MNVGFIGCGRMGGSLASKLASAGHKVTVSASKFEHASEFCKTRPEIMAGTPEQASPP